MEELLPELRSAIGPRLKGKAQERQRTWIQVRVVAVGTPGPNLHPPCNLLPPHWGTVSVPVPPGWAPGGFPAGGTPPAPLCAIARSPARPSLLPRAREANGKKPGPRAKPSPAIFSEPFLGQRRLNPAQDLAKG